MQVSDWIKIALDSGRSALSEHESKRILAAYDIPVVDEKVAADADAAAAAAAEIGYPVVLTGLGAELSHKS